MNTKTSLRAFGITAFSSLAFTIVLLLLGPSGEAQVPPVASGSAAAPPAVPTRSADKPAASSSTSDRSSDGKGGSGSGGSSGSAGTGAGGSGAPPCRACVPCCSQAAPQAPRPPPERWCERKLRAPFKDFALAAAGADWTTPPPPSATSALSDGRPALFGPGVAYDDLDAGARPLEDDLGLLTMEGLIASVPDPVDTGSSYYFEGAIEALQLGVEQSDFLRDQAWLPWNDTTLLDPRQRASVEACRREVPGVILFRTRSPSVHKGLALFLVGETPTGGVHRAALQTAVRWLGKLLPSGDSRKHPLRLVGPYYSGSGASIRETLDALKIEAEPPLIRLVSGSATQPEVAQAFSGHDAGPGPAASATVHDAGPGPAASASTSVFTFELTNLTDDVLQCAALQYLLEKRFVGQSPDGVLEGVALLTESGTLYGSGARESYWCQKPQSNDAGTNDAGTNDAGTGGAGTGGAGTNDAGTNDAGVCPSEIIHFPRNIAQIRSAHEARASGPEGVQADSSLAKVRGPTLSPTLDDQFSREQSRSATTRSIVAEDSALSNMLEQISRDDIRYVLIRATDSADVIFLAQQIRLTSPDVRLVLFGNDALYTHPSFRQSLEGSLVITAYPYLGAGPFIPPLKSPDDGAKALPSHLWTFRTSEGEGLYNAVRAQMPDQNDAGPDGGRYFHGFREYSPLPAPKSADPGAADAGPPFLPVWISTVGYRALAPLAVKGHHEGEVKSDRTIVFPGGEAPAVELRRRLKKDGDTDERNPRLVGTERVLELVPTAGIPKLWQFALFLLMLGSIANAMLHVQDERRVEATDPEAATSGGALLEGVTAHKWLIVLIAISAAVLLWISSQYPRPEALQSDHALAMVRSLFVTLFLACGVVLFLSSRPLNKARATASVAALRRTLGSRLAPSLGVLFFAMVALPALTLTDQRLLKLILDATVPANSWRDVVLFGTAMAVTLALGRGWLGLLSWFAKLGARHAEFDPSHAEFDPSRARRHTRDDVHVALRDTYLQSGVKLDFYRLVGSCCFLFVSGVAVWVHFAALSVPGLVLGSGAFLTLAAAQLAAALALWTSAKQLGSLLDGLLLLGEGAVMPKDEDGLYQDFSLHNLLAGLHGADLPKDNRAVNYAESMVALGVLVVVCGAMGKGLFQIWLDLQASRDVHDLFVLRTMTLDNDASPIMPLLACTVGLYVWSRGRMARLYMLRRLSQASPAGAAYRNFPVPIAYTLAESPPYPDVPSLELSDIAQLERRLMITLERPATAGRWILALTLGVFAIPVVLFRLRPPDLLAPDHGLLVGIVALNVWLLGATIVHMITYWMKLRPLLRRLQRHPIAASLGRLPEVLSEPMSRLMVRQHEEVLRWTTCASLLTQLRARVARVHWTLVDVEPLSAALKERSDAADAGMKVYLAAWSRGDLAHTLAGGRAYQALLAAGHDVSLVLQRPWRGASTPAKALPEYLLPSDKPAAPTRGEVGENKVSSLDDPLGHLHGVVKSGEMAGLRELEELPAALVAVLLKGHIRLFRAFMTSLIQWSMCLLFMFATYAFEPRRLFLIFMWIIVLSIVSSGLTIFVQMDQNAVISRMGRQTPGEVTFSRDFFVRLFSWVVIPLISIAALQFQEIAAAVFVLVEPVLKVLR